MRFLGLMAILLLGACGPDVTDLQGACAYNAKPFDQSWGCMKQAMVDNRYATRYPADIYQQYVTVGNVVAERQSQGRISDAEAKAVMAEALVAATNGMHQRMPASGGGPMTCNNAAGTLICY